jgi:putrescine transport system ATP-binding protein
LDEVPYRQEVSEAVIRIDGVAKAFAGHTALAGVSLSIMAGEFFSLLGPSGCGKTTLLRLLAGFEAADAGGISIGGADMQGVAPYDRPVNMMFQSYALFPHMTVAGNIAFGLGQTDMTKREIEARVDELLVMLHLAKLARRKPHQLSGGEKQRTALARCLARKPLVVLLDEPMAALDKRLRDSTRSELVEIQKKVGTTFVMVTHDQEEAMAVSSRIAVMEAGRILQVGSPREVYEFPQSRAVAKFIGTANFFEGVVVGHSREGVRLHCGHEGLDMTAPGEYPMGTRLALLVRPEKFSLGKDIPPGDNHVPAEVVEEVYQGGTSQYKLRLFSGNFVTVNAANLRHAVAKPVAVGDKLSLSWHPADGVLLP